MLRKLGQNRFIRAKNKEKTRLQGNTAHKKTTKAEQFFDENIFGENQTVGNYLWIVRFEGKKRLQNLKNDELKKKPQNPKNRNPIFSYIFVVWEKRCHFFFSNQISLHFETILLAF